MPEATGIAKLALALVEEAASNLGHSCRWAVSTRLVLRPTVIALVSRHAAYAAAGAALPPFRKSLCGLARGGQVLGTMPLEMVRAAADVAQHKKVPPQAVSYLLLLLLLPHPFLAP